MSSPVDFKSLLQISAHEATDETIALPSSQSAAGVLVEATFKQ